MERLKKDTSYIIDIDGNDFYVEFKTINPSDTDKLLEKNTSNRPLNLRQVEYYSQMMKLGKWGFNGDSICISKTEKLLNGQHRLNAIKKSDKKQTMIVLKGFEEDAFQYMDKNKVRSFGDDLCASGIKNYNIVASSIQKWTRLSRNLTIHENSNKAQLKMISQDVRDIYHKNQYFYDTIINECGRIYRKFRFVTQSDLVGIASYLCLEKFYSREKVTEFFEMLYGISGKKMECAKQLFEIYLKSIESKSKTKLSLQYRYIIISKCWQKFKKGDYDTKFAIKQNDTIKFE